MQQIIIVIIISYLIGSIPTAYIFGRLIKKVDIRKFGSGNVGATNALRLLGKGWGITVLIIDILKGCLPVIFLGNFMQDQNLRIAIGLACICGHNWTIFLKFKGGKGVATTFGVLIALSLTIPGLKIVLGLTILVWFITFIISRMISLSSILSALSFPVLTIIFRQSLIIISISILLSLFLIYRHKANILRIMQGKESRLSFNKQK